MIEGLGVTEVIEGNYERYFFPLRHSSFMLSSRDLKHVPRQLTASEWCLITVESPPPLLFSRVINRKAYLHSSILIHFFPFLYRFFGPSSGFRTSTDNLSIKEEKEKNQQISRCTALFICQSSYAKILSGARRPVRSGKLGSGVELAAS